MVDNLILYRENKDSLFYRFSKVLLEENVGADFAHSAVSDLIFFGAKHGFYGNLWHCYMANLIVNSENPYSLDCEIRGDLGGSVSELALKDFDIFLRLFHIDLKVLEDRFSIDAESIIDFHMNSDVSKMLNLRIRDCICELSVSLEKADSKEEFREYVASFYKHFGVGVMGLHKAFRLDDNGDIEPINRIKHANLSDLVGYEHQKKQLIDNTESFINDKAANNCLLFGDSGTGKSTSIKAIANEYYESGLRIVEVYKHQFKYLNKLIGTLKDRNYKFIIYMDDLSFEDFEIEYKYLKAVIEGGLEKKPDNVLIYATSNRRHLIHESVSDNKEYDDMHKNDTKQEKLSLSRRFGVTIYFGAPSPKEFKEIVLALKERYELDIPDEEVLMQANAWEISHGGLSGRTAQQFIDYLRGK